MRVLTVVPGPTDPTTGYHLAQGTKVILDDGSELQGVHGISLRAGVGGVWTATIECSICQVPTIKANDSQL